jgi:hypothetical protein
MAASINAIRVEHAFGFQSMATRPASPRRPSAMSAAPRRPSHAHTIGHANFSLAMFKLKFDVFERREPAVARGERRP